MKQSTKRFLSTALALLFFVGAIVIYSSFLVPAYTDMQQVKSQVVSRQALINEQQSQIKKVQSLVAAYEGEGNLQDTVSAMLPMGEDVPVVVSQLSGLLENSGLAAKSFTVSSAATGIAPAATGTLLMLPVASVNVQVRFSGTYAQFKNFLSKLETNIRIFDLKTLAISPSGIAVTGQAFTGDPVYNFDMSVAAHYQMQK